MRVLPVGEARDHFSELLGEVEQTHERVRITRHGRDIAVVLSPDDLAALEGTLDLLATPGAVDAIEEGKADLAAGRRSSLAEVLAEFRHD